mmetsp:Transcript_7256/g.14899  ORF Transcript_7256/g.14899 Transcript_7256/m.14899 type:complete len:83 (-) Transcript_7256:32-280(-)
MKMINGTTGDNILLPLLYEQKLDAESCLTFGQELILHEVHYNHLLSSFGNGCIDRKIKIRCHGLNSKSFATPFKKALIFILS